MKYAVKEEGRNGTVEVLPDRIIRTFKKTFGRDDVQTIPIRSVTSVHHDKKRVGSDSVSVAIGTVTYVWKTSSAEALVEDLHSAVYGTQP